MFKLFTAIATVAVLGSAAQALAGPPVETMSVKVHVSDLDLSHADGARVAYRRISYAADRICGGEPANQYIEGRRAYVACMNAIVHESVARLEPKAPTGVTLVAGR